MDPSARKDADTAAAASSSLPLIIPHPPGRSGDEQVTDDGWTKTNINSPLHKGQFSIPSYRYCGVIFSFLSIVKVTA